MQRVQFCLVDISQHRVRTKIFDLAGNEYLASGHILSQTFARISQNNDAPAVHHVTRHEIGIAHAA